MSNVETISVEPQAILILMEKLTCVLIQNKNIKFLGYVCALYKTTSKPLVRVARAARAAP